MRPSYCRLMWCLSVMCKVVTLVNSKWDIWSCAWLQIQHHPYNKIIWFGTISFSLRTIRVFPNRCINLGGYWQLITMLHPCGFQEFADQSSLEKLKSTIIRCIDINAQELRHWFFLWSLPIINGTILLERIHYITNIKIVNVPKRDNHSHIPHN